MDRAAPSRMALITSDEENTSESGSGSVQVQATDLYPLDMYDGGSQFQPSSLRLGGSSLVLEEDANNQKRLVFIYYYHVFINSLFCMSVRVEFCN